MEFQLSEVKVQRMFFIQKVEKRRKDLKYLQCTIKHTELLDLVNKSIETMFGQFQKQNIDLAMLKKRFLREQVSHFILKELTESFLKLSLLRKLLKTLNLLLKTS